jgi:hypothetical protein
LSYSKVRITGLLACWLVAVVGCFYVFFWRFIQPFDFTGLYPDGQVNQHKLIDFVSGYTTSGNDLFIFHWLNPDCRCTQFTGDTIAQLAADPHWAGAQHLLMVPPGKATALVELLPQLLDLTEVAGYSIVTLSESAYRQSSQLIPATPGALIFDLKKRSVSYLGPHNAGVVCGTGSSYVELVLNNLQQGFDPQLLVLEQNGCFCRW